MHAWAAAVAGLLSSSCPLSQILLIALWALGLIVSFAVLPWSGVGSKNGVYYAVDQDTGALVWQQAVVAGGEAGGFSPSTGVAFGKIYAATFTGPPYIFALDATNGAVAWQCPPTECNVFSFGPAGIAGGVFFVGAMPQSRRRAPTSRHERRPVGAPSPTDQPAALPRGKSRWPAGCTRDV